MNFLKSHIQLGQRWDPESDKGGLSASEHMLVAGPREVKSHVDTCGQSFQAEGAAWKGSAKALRQEQ